MTRYYYVPENSVTPPVPTDRNGSVLLSVPEQYHNFVKPSSVLFHTVRPEKVYKPVVLPQRINGMLCYPQG